MENKKEFKYVVYADDLDPTSFSPSYIRENRRHEVINNSIKLCRQLIKDFGSNDQREQDYLLAKIGMALLGQGMLPLQAFVVELDHEEDLALEAKFGKLSDYVNKPAIDEGHTYEDCLKHEMLPMDEKEKFMNIKQIDSKYHIELESTNNLIETIVELEDIKATIRKTSNNEDIPIDEPLIIFRAKDRLAVPLLLHYLEICKKDKCVPQHLDGMVQIIRQFESFRKANPDKMKQPGITRGL